jgi:dihydrofolate synthase/folylpolyglutamate synthase
MNDNFSTAIKILKALDKPDLIKEKSLSSFTKMMGTLNNPFNKYRTIHIAGTNGKGSVALKLAKILSNAGYRTGLYISPHLFTFRERIQVNG